jgi:hypothetical protein
MRIDPNRVFGGGRSGLVVPPVRTANKFDVLNSSVHENEVTPVKSSQHLSRKTVQFQKDSSGMDSESSWGKPPVVMKMHRSKSQSPKRVEPKHDAMADEEKLKEKIDGFHKKAQEASAAAVAGSNKI